MGVDLREWAEREGVLIAWGSCEVVGDVLTEIEERRARGEFDDKFYGARLGWLPEPGACCPEGARTAILLAVPRPAHHVTFTLETGPLDALLPPTYVQYGQARERLRRSLQRFLHGKAHLLDLLRAPLRATAARLGLVQYGLNNLAYIPELGSYHQIVGFLTDFVPSDPSPYPAGPPRVMPRCKDCGLCRETCPTGAIPEDRFLLRAERCLTFHNEAPEPWPSWMDASLHHCLMGCLRCQETCPENPGPPAIEPTDVVFTAEETGAMLEPNENRSGPRWDSIRRKLRLLALEEDEALVGRNLRALLEALSA